MLKNGGVLTMKKRVSLFIFLVFLLFFIAMSQTLWAKNKGHWEFGVHYSSWNVAIFTSTVRSGLNDVTKPELRDKYLEDIQKNHPNFVKESYTQKVSYDSGGNNFGFEGRWYPDGERGSFSLGLSVEKTTMNLTFTEIPGTLVVKDTVTHETGIFEGTAKGKVVLKPLSFHLSLRWDIKPSWRVRPFISFGLGASLSSAINNAELNYNYTGTLTIPGRGPEHYEDSDAKTGKQVKEEMEEEGDKVPLTFVPFLQLSLGLKGAITKNLYLLVDLGIWDGFMLRGGIAFRI